jgi:hypothetical protein
MGTVTLKRVGDNQIFTLPYDKLSEEDVSYIKSLKNPSPDAFNSEFFISANKIPEMDNYMMLAPIIKPYREIINKMKPSNYKQLMGELNKKRLSDLAIYLPLSKGSFNSCARFARL